MATFTKDPQSTLDYKFNWADWLAADETIATHTVIADSGLTLDSSEITDSSTSVTCWLSGGEAIQNYKLNCEIVTSDARTDQRTVIIRVRER